MDNQKVILTVIKRQQGNNSSSIQNGTMMRSFITIPLIVIILCNIIFTTTTTSAVDLSSWRIGNNVLIIPPSSSTSSSTSSSSSLSSLSLIRQRKATDLGSIVFLNGGSDSDSSIEDNNDNNSETTISSTSRGVGHDDDNNDNNKNTAKNSNFPDRGGNSTATAALKQPNNNSNDNECEVDELKNEFNNITATKQLHHLYENTDTANTAIQDGEHPQKKKRKFFKKKERKVDPTSSAAAYSKKLKNRNSLNIKRKFTHAGFGFLFAALNHLIPRQKFLPFMTALSTFTLFMEMMRYRKGFGWINDVLIFFLGSSLRKHEMEGKFTGSLYYFLGVTCTSYLFPKTAATMGIFQLAIADPSASYFGRNTRHIYWSRIDRGFYGLGRNKGILGFLGGGLACVPLNYYVLRIANWSKLGMTGTGLAIIPGGQLALITASIGLGLAGAFADLAVPTPALTLPHKICGITMPPFHVDDNVVVPVVSGFACTKIFQALGWSSSLELAKYIFV